MNLSPVTLTAATLSDPKTSVLRIFRAPFTVAKKMWGFLRFFIACLVVIRDPSKTDSIIASAEALATPERFAATIAYHKSLPGGAELFRDKPLFPSLSLERLSKFPMNSLGRRFASHMIENGLDPDFYPDGFHDDVTYSYYRFGKTHDLWHVVTGYDTSIRGELGLLGFSFAQTTGPGIMLLIALVLLHGVIFAPGEVVPYFKSVVSGWERGLKAKSLYALNWGDLLSRPLGEVRNELGLA